MFLCVKKIKKFICSLFAGGPREVEEHEMWCLEIVRNRTFKSHQHYLNALSLYKLTLSAYICTPSNHQDHCLVFFYSILNSLFVCKYTQCMISKKCFNPRTTAESVWEEGIKSLNEMVLKVEATASHYLETPHLGFIAHAPAWGHPHLPGCSPKPANKQKQTRIK
jgi:hypothetical protein